MLFHEIDDDTTSSYGDERCLPVKTRQQHKVSGTTAQQSTLEVQVEGRQA
jgi:hypothetical protein